MRRRLPPAAAVVLLAAGCGGGSGHTAGTTAATTTAATSTAPVPAPAPGARVRGIVLLVPGSAFRGVSPGAPRPLRFGAPLWLRWGLRPHVVSYSPGPQGLRDVEHALAVVHREAPDAPVCLYGESSGGSWALLTAAHDPSVRCVIAAAAPTDQETWARSNDIIARSLATRTWSQLFGSDPHQDNAFEPYDVWGAVHPRVPVLALYGQGDPAVPPQQGRIFERADPSAILHVLPRGGRLFIHSKVTAAARARALGEMRRFVLRYARR
jgi:dienelactone hydrolase